MVEPSRHEKRLNSLPSLGWTIGNCNNDLTKALKNGTSFCSSKYIRNYEHEYRASNFEKVTKHLYR